MPAIVEVGQRVLRAACLVPSVEAACRVALTKPGRLFSAVPIWSRLFLAWSAALTEDPGEAFLRAAVACECMAAGYDLIDAHYDRTHDPAARDGLTHGLPAGVTLLLLAQELLARLDLPAERRARAGAALSSAGRRACTGQMQDYALRRQPTASQDEVLAILRRRSGTLAAAPCQCAALLAGAPWRTVALAGRFGRAFGCAAQLADDLADRVEDEQSGKKTVPFLLAQLYPAAPELVEATTLVLIQRFLQEAAQALARLPIHRARTEVLWTLLPADARAA